MSDEQTEPPDREAPAPPAKEDRDGHITPSRRDVPVRLERAIPDRDLFERR